MTAVASQAALGAGTIVTWNAAPATIDVPNQQGNALVIIRNGSGASINATIRGQGKAADVTIPDRVVAIAAGQDRAFFLDPALYQKADGTVQIDLSATASVTVGIFSLPQ